MSTRILSVASAALIAAFATTGTLAADLGGNCCADLEERVAELENTVVRSAKDSKQQVIVSGQVHALALIHGIDEADRPRASIIDGGHSQTRVNVAGKARINQDLHAGFRLSIGVGGFEIGTGASTTDLVRRESYVFLKSKSAGKLSVGLQSTSTDGIAELDLGQTGLASVPLSLAPADQALLGISLSHFDGSRAEVIRYTSPAIGGFELSAAWAGDNSTRDVALRYAGEFGAIRVAAGVGWRQDDLAIGGFTLAEDVKTVAGSASVMHVPSGLFASASYAKQDLGEGNVEVWGIRGGIKAKISALGATRFFVEYNEARNIFDLDAKPSTIGAGLIQDITPGAMQGYISWKQFDEDNLAGGAIDKTDLVMFGLKVNF